MKVACKAQLDNFICDSSRCQEALRQSSDKPEGTGTGAIGSQTQTQTLALTLETFLIDIKKHFSEAGVAIGTFWTVYSRRVTALYSQLYTRHLQMHVEDLMHSESVLQFLEHVDYLEGKTHVFFYYMWKDTPRVVNKVIRELQYLGYFIHWKGKLAVASLAVMARNCLTTVGVRGVSLSVIEGVIYLIGACLILLLLLRIRKRIWAMVVRFFGMVCFLLLCPYWIVTKPFRVIYGLFFN